MGELQYFQRHVSFGLFTYAYLQNVCINIVSTVPEELINNFFIISQL
jgi:hypothetical protein